MIHGPAEVLLAQLVPPVLHRVALRRIWGQEQQPHGRNRGQIVGDLRAGSVEHHDDVVACVTTGDLVEEQLHAYGAPLRQQQGVELSVPQG